MELAATLLLLSKVLAVAFAFECVRRLASSQQFNPLRIWRRTAMLTRQFPGPKPSSFLLGAVITCLYAQTSRWSSVRYLMEYCTSPYGGECMR
jgi:hypothetical protein